MQCFDRGVVATGGRPISIYPPKIRPNKLFLWSNDDARTDRTVVEVELIPQSVLQFYTSQNKFMAVGYASGIWGNTYDVHNEKVKYNGSDVVDNGISFYYLDYFKSNTTLIG